MRLAMANNVATWLGGNPTADPAAANRNYFLIGDFNSYYGEDPVQTLRVILVRRDEQVAIGLGARMGNGLLLTVLTWL